VKAPLLLYASSLVEAAPLATAVVMGWTVRGAGMWLVVWSTLLFAESGIMYVLAMRGIHNLWVSYLFTPLTAATLLWALSGWQAGNTARRAMRMAIVPLLVLWLALTLAFDSTRSFSRTADPLAVLVQLFAAAFTLVARSRASAGDLLHQDWFWVSAGLALYLGTSSMIEPLSFLLARTDVALMLRAYQLEAAFQVIAFLAIVRGLTCPATVTTVPDRQRA
jgi:hypothetical protein